MCNLYGLEQLVTVPTRGQNTLDLIMTDFPDGSTVSAHPPIGKSDHVILISDLPLAQPKAACEKTCRKVWRYGQADWPRLQDYYRSTDWSQIITENVDESCKQLTARILAGMEQFIPSATLRKGPAEPPWWTPECAQAVKTKQQAWRSLRHAPNDPRLQSIYREATEMASACHARAKHCHTASIRRKISNGEMSSREWWSTVKRAAGRSRAADIPLLSDVHGNEAATNKEKSECFAEHFASKCSLPNDLDADHIPQVTQRSAAEIHTVHFRPATVRKELRNLNPSKATGSDGIPGRVLKMCSDELCNPVAKLFAKAFHQGRQPQLWKLASVVPVHKKRSKSDVRNYRPISLLPILSKVMEAIINRSLTNFLESNNILSRRQYGFRRGLSTQDVLTLLSHRWHTAAVVGGATRIIAVDIAGAFDKVSHPGIIHKCQQQGVGGALLTWLTDYLTSRQLQAVVGGSTSLPHPVTAGVPQGSILGPTLFLLYVNDAEDHLPAGVELATYADDTTMYHSIATLGDIADGSALLQHGLDRLAEWGAQWRITFEPTKSQAMTIAFHRQTWPVPPVMFAGTQIQEKSCLRLLGVDFDSGLSFRQHVRSIACRASQRLGLLRKAAPVLDPAGRERVYKGFVRPVMEYCPLVWMSCPASHLAALDRVQKKALQIIGPGCWLTTLAHRRLVAACCFLYKLLYLPADHPLHPILPPAAPRQPEDRTRTRLAAAVSQRHQLQLCAGLSRHARESIRRAFPACAVSTWNALPTALLQNAPSKKRQQCFKVKVHRHLLHQDWLANTDSL